MCFNKNVCIKVRNFREASNFILFQTPHEGNQCSEDAQVKGAKAAIKIRQVPICTHSDPKFFLEISETFS